MSAAAGGEGGVEDRAAAEVVVVGRRPSSRTSSVDVLLEQLVVQPLPPCMEPRPTLAGFRDDEQGPGLVGGLMLAIVFGIARPRSCCRSR